MKSPVSRLKKKKNLKNNAKNKIFPWFLPFSTDFQRKMTIFNEKWRKLAENLLRRLSFSGHANSPDSGNYHFFSRFSKKFRRKKVENRRFLLEKPWKSLKFTWFSWFSTQNREKIPKSGRFAPDFGVFSTTGDIFNIFLNHFFQLS